MAISRPISLGLQQGLSSPRATAVVRQPSPVDALITPVTRIAIRLDRSIAATIILGHEVSISDLIARRPTLEHW